MKRMLEKEGPPEYFGKLIDGGRRLVVPHPKPFLRLQEEVLLHLHHRE